MMPEHVHLLIYPRADEYSISRILSTLKQPVSKRSILFVRREAPTFLSQLTDVQPNGKTELRFWQRGGGWHAHAKCGMLVDRREEYGREDAAMSPVRMLAVDRVITMLVTSICEWIAGCVAPLPR